jgi:hypothetical protein
MGTKTMTKNLYNELDDLHPRVNYLLNMDNWCVINEAKVETGKLDFLAIQRHTGRMMIVECKVSFVNTLKLIAQINRYHDALGVPDAEKCLMTFERLRDVQLEALADENIQSKVVNLEMPMMPRWIGGGKSEFAYWFKHWDHEALEGGTMYSWLQSSITFGNPLPTIDENVRAPFRTRNPLRLDGTSLPYNPGSSAPYVNWQTDNLDDPHRYSND